MKQAKEMIQNRAPSSLYGLFKDGKPRIQKG